MNNGKKGKAHTKGEILYRADGGDAKTGGSALSGIN